MSVLPISVPTKRLSAPITSSALSFTVNNILGWDGVALTAGQFGTLHYVCFRNSTNTLMEVVEIDATTIASASITITKRGLNFVGGTTSVAANQLAWPANDTLVDFGSDPAQLLTQGYIDKWTSETLPTGVIKTFVTLPRSSTAPSNAADLVNKTYADGLAIAGAPDSSTTTKGIVKMSVAPASATSPIAVGDNDTRVPTAGQAAALPATTTPAASNLYLTQKDFQKGVEIAGSTTGSANAYVFTPSPAIAAYAAGMTFRLKANFTNSGAATVNVSGLGAIAIKKRDGTVALASGDIVSGQEFEVIYDGANFQMVSPVAVAPLTTVTFNRGTTTRNMNASSGSQTIAHGLSAAPKRGRIIAAYKQATNGEFSLSIGSYDGAGSNCIFLYGSTMGALPGTSSNMVESYETATISQIATIAVDATNITLTWTKAGSGAAVAIQILWEAETNA
jgi:hypothetical protein